MRNEKLKVNLVFEIEIFYNNEKVFTFELIFLLLL